MKTKNLLRIVIVNTHSTLNSGDAGIVMAQLQFLRKHFPDCRITMTSRTLVLDTELYSPFDVILLPPIIPTPVVFSSIPNKWRENLTNMFSVSGRFKLIREILRCDLVFACGGGYFYSNRRYFPGPMFFQNYLHTLFAVVLRKPLIFFPQSFGPFYNKTAVFLIKRILRGGKTKKIWSREEISYKLVNDLIGKKGNVNEVCPDVAFNLDIKGDYKKNITLPDLPRPLVALTIRDWSFPGSKDRESIAEKKEQYMSSIVDVGKDICNNLNGSLMFVPHSRGFVCSENDKIITDEIIDRLEKLIPRERIYCPEIEDSADPLYVASLLSKADLVIATRFHSAIFALSSGVPVISISYQYKSEGIMKMLELEQFSLQISDLKGEEVLLLVKYIFDNYDSIRKKIEENVLKMRDDIEKLLLNGVLSFVKGAGGK